MSETSEPQHAFWHVFQAVSDTWLQIRTKPVLYLMIWASLSLVPYLLLGQIFSQPIGRVLTEFMESAQDYSLSSSSLASVPPEMMDSFFQLIMYYFLFWVLSSLVVVFYNVVLFNTIRKFRDQLIPRYSEVVQASVPLYLVFLKSIMFAAWKILWQPVSIFLFGILLGLSFQQSFLSTAGFFTGLMLLYSGWCRYGLAPIIRMNTGLSNRESCFFSQRMYQKYRPIISFLFLSLVIFPLVLVLLLLTLFLRMEIIFGIGSLFIWLVHSLLQLIVLMSLVNFTTNYVPYAEVISPRGASEED